MPAQVSASPAEGTKLSDPLYDAFRRDDLYGDMGKGPIPTKEKIRLCVLLLLLAPVRLLSAVILLLLFYANLKLAAWIPLYGRTAVPTLAGRALTRVCLAVLGLLHIKRVNLAGASKDQVAEKHPVLIVSNHVSWLDTVIHFYLHFPASFIMKQAVFGIPIIGDIGKHICCIGVVREDKADGDKGVSQLVADRLEEEHSKPPNERRAVLVFPEGTTTNGKYLLAFKSGAFRAGLPCKPIILKYHTVSRQAHWLVNSPCGSTNGLRCYL